MKNHQVDIICFIDSLGSGGAQRQISGLANFLNKKGYIASVVWYHDNNFFQEYLITNNVVTYKFAPKNKFEKFLLFYNYVNEVRPKCVIAFLDGPTVIACVTRIFSSHQFKLVVSERNTTKTSTIRARIKFFLYRFADYIVPNSYTQSEYISKHYKHLTEKVKTIINFVDTSFFVPAFNLEYKSDVKSILVIGRINEQKNVLTFLRSIRQVIDRGLCIKIEWYGHAKSDSYKQQCLELKDKLSLSPFFTFHDEVKDVLTLYQNSQVLCLPSTYEGFPNVICEAMSCGLPILCSDVCDNGIIVKNGVNGFLFNPYAINDIADKIVNFFELSIEERIEMGKKSRDIAVSAFSSEEFIRKYIELL